MSRVLTNFSSFAAAIEESGQIGTLPVSPTWRLLEPNNIPRGGAEITTIPRRPISKNRQNRKGAVTDLDSGFEAELDLTREHLLFFLPVAMYTVWTGPRYFRVVAVNDTTDYQVPGDATDVPVGSLVVVSGCNIAANNTPESFRVVTAVPDATHIEVAETLVNEAAIPVAQNALLEVAGFRGASGDLEIDVTGGVVSLISNGGVDFTDLRLNVGQFIWIGGTGTNAFNTAANRGLARIVSIAAGAIVLDKMATTFVTDAGVGRTVDLYFGRWARNVAIGHADYLEQSMTIETTFTDLDGVGNPLYGYSRGNLINNMALSFQGQDKATMTLELVGLDTEPPTDTRATNASAPLAPVQVAALNTAADFCRLRVTEADETGVTSDFKDMTLTFGNNVSPEKVLGTLGARYMNSGNFDVSGETNVVLTDVAVMEAVRDNRLMTAEVGFRNGDGGFVFDFPSITLGNGVPEFTPDESVTLPLTIQAVQDTTLGYTMSVSSFPYLPAS